MFEKRVCYLLSKSSLLDTIELSETEARSDSIREALVVAQAHARFARVFFTGRRLGQSL